MYEQIEQNDWMGPDVNTLLASHFDDFRNKIDIILEYEQETGTNFVGLGIDVTYGHGPFLASKLQQIRREIDSGTLSEVRYFESTDGTVKGELLKRPRLIISSEKDQVVNLMEKWVKRKNKDLAADPVQLQILDEMMMQLKIFKKYAERKGKNDIVKIYEKVIKIIERIQELPGKKNLYEQTDTEKAYKNKPFYREFEQMLKAVFFKEV